VLFARDVRSSRPWADRILINGSIGPTGDGYSAERKLSPDDAQNLHTHQMEAFAKAGVDLAMAATMTHTGEAIGVARAADAVGIPVGISFTVETDGKLPDGASLADAIFAVENATGGSPVFYGVNCAHPTHFIGELVGPWLDRIGVIRANASTLSHAELDTATELDDGDPDEFGRLYGSLAARLPGLRIVGGCCGSDCRHVAAVALAT
jgi:S-methylmethionine-dependent homocysteine/selenocysteine methylase